MRHTSQHKLALQKDFDPRTCRHTLDGRAVVLHCHHFATLYSQLADDCDMLDGKKLLAEVAEDSFSAALTDYFTKRGVSSVVDRVGAAEQYYSLCGLGKLIIKAAGPEFAEAELAHSHLDEGWVKKFGKRDKPVNFITSGFLAGALAAIFGRAPRTYIVSETQSIVAGAECSKFSAVAQ